MKIAVPAIMLLALVLFGWLVASNAGVGKSGVIRREHGIKTLMEYCGEEPPEVEFAEDGSLCFMQGSLDGTNVRDDVDALAVLGGIDDLLNIWDAKEELVFDKSGSVGNCKVYRFQQCHNGIPVLGKAAIVGTDGSGVVRTINADTIDVGHPATEASVGAEEAFAVAEKTASDYVVSCRGLAYWPLERGVELAWVVACSEELCIVSATSGEVLALVPTVWTMEGVDGIHEGSDRVSFNVEESAGSYQLVDDERNITYHDAEDLNVRIRIDFKNDAGETYYRYDEASEKLVNLRDNTRHDYDEFVAGMAQAECMLCHIDRNGEHLTEEAACYCKRFPESVPIYEDSDNVWKDSRALDVVSAINRSYDFYAKVGWRGLYGHNHPLHVYLYDNLKGDRTNAKASAYGYITVGTECDARYEVIEHEYTHTVLDGIAQLGIGTDAKRSLETRTLHEAYSDILSLIITRNDSWASSEGYRNLMNPDQSINKHQLSYYNPDNMKEEHKACTIIGHAAYLMYEGGLSWEELADLWYGSIWYLTPTADFDTCRRSVLATAKGLDMTDEKQGVIREAFDAVGVFEKTSIVLKPDAMIAAYNVDRTPHEGIAVYVEDPSLTASRFGDDVNASVITDGSSVCLSELLSGSGSGIVPVTTNLRRLSLRVEDATGSGESHQWSVVLSKEGHAQLNVYFDTRGSAEDHQDDSLDSSDSQDSSDYDAACDRIETQSGKPIVYTVRRDFDADGHEEAFVIVGDAIDAQSEAWSHAELWFVDSRGEVSTVADERTFDLSLRYIDTLGDGSSPNTFISLENTGFGSGGVCHVYTVRDGMPTEVAFDIADVMWLCNEGGKAKGTVSVWGEGHHQYQDYLFSYDEASNTMVSTGAAGGPY